MSMLGCTSKDVPFVGSVEVLQTVESLSAGHREYQHLEDLYGFPVTKLHSSLKSAWIY